MPAFSVVVPTFNRPRLLSRAIRSVLAQSERDWELLVVNDGDGDIAAEVAQAGAGDARVRTLATGGRRGAAFGRNAGIAAARGDVVCFLDDDDEYLPGYLAAIGTAFAAGAVDFCWTGVHRIRTTSRGTTQVTDLVWDESSEKGGSRRFVLEIATSCGLAIRRACLTEHGAFDEGLRTSEDRDLIFRLIERGCRYAAVPQPLLNVHVQRNQGLSEWRRSAERSAASARDDEVVMQRHAALIAADPPLRLSYLQRIARKYYHARATADYWRTLRALAPLGGLSTKIVTRALTVPLRALWLRARTGPT